MTRLPLLKKWILAPLFLAFFFSCKKDKIDDSPVIEKEFNLTGFNRVYAAGSFNITITKGADFQIRAKGPAKYVNDIALQVMNGHTLDIQFDRTTNTKQVDVFITVPELYQFNLAAGGKGKTNGFANGNHTLRIVLSAGSKCEINGAPVNVGFDLYAGSQLDVTGTSENLYGTLSAGSKLNAFNLLSGEVDIEANGGSIANVNVQDIIFAAAYGGSKIHYKGDPFFKEFETNGGGEIIKE